MILYLLSLLSLAATNNSTYTNHQAMTCFGEHALQKCKDHFDNCMQDKLCDHELQHYQRCHFGLKENESPHVFNGYCFRKWKEGAVRSKEVIDCFYDECNLGYNSDVGLEELYKCSELVMSSEGIQCDDACLDEMGSLIGNQVYSKPLLQLYSQQFENPQVAKIIHGLRQHCVKDGKYKKQVEDEIGAFHQQRFQKSRPSQEQQEAKQDL